MPKTTSDPAGETVQAALGRLGFTEVNSVRIGKHFEIAFAADTMHNAELKAKTMCEQLLANLVVESFVVEVSEG